METERERMLQGELYDPQNAELQRARLRARRLSGRLNGSDPAAVEERLAILRELFGSVGEDAWIEPPFYCDYGNHIHLGARVFLNFNCVILDPAEVHVGDRVMLGPSVQVYTATHPLQHHARALGLESARAVTIGADAWIGGGAVLLPGARVGARSVVGAGSVVTGEVPDDVVAMGNPCRVVRRLA